MKPDPVATALGQTAEQRAVPHEPGTNLFRWWVLTLLFTGITINLLDRQVLSVVAPVLRETLGLSATGYGSIVFAFMLGMTLMQIPAGILLDRFGARLGLTAMCTWWSTVNLLHSFARSVAQFSVLRFLLGAGECGNYSGGLKVIAEWFPARERALASGIFNSGSLVGSIVAVPLITWIILHFGWPSAFVLPSLLGFFWAAAWFATFRSPLNLPARGGVSGTDTLRFSQLLRMRQVWGVFGIRALAGPVTQFYWWWLPEYLKRVRGLSLQAIGVLGAIPYVCGGMGNIFGGWFSSHLIRRGWAVDPARKAAYLVSIAMTATSALIPFTHSARVALIIICIANMGINCFAATFMATLADIFPHSAVARVAGITGIGDSGMSMCLMLLTGIVVDHYSYLPVFIAAATTPALAVVILYAVVRKIEPL